jgi:hypothetical protein
VLEPAVPSLGPLSDPAVLEPTVASPLPVSVARPLLAVPSAWVVPPLLPVVVASVVVVVPLPN